MTIFGLFWCKFVLQFEIGKKKMVIWDYHFFCSNKNFTIFFVPTKNGILPFFLFQKHTPPQISPPTAQNAVAHAHTNAYEHQSMHTHVDTHGSHTTHTPPHSNTPAGPRSACIETNWRSWAKRNVTRPHPRWQNHLLHHVHTRECKSWNFRFAFFGTKKMVKFLVGKKKW